MHSSVYFACTENPVVPCCREEGEESRLTIMALRVELQSAQTGQDLLQSQLQAVHRELECEREALQQQGALALWRVLVRTCCSAG